MRELNRSAIRNFQVCISSVFISNKGKVITVYSKPLQAWQVITSGICGLILTIGLARFAYTPLLPAMQLQTGLSDSGAGALAAINYAGYMTGVLIASWMDDEKWRHRFYEWGMWLAVFSTATMSITDSMPVWFVSRYVGGLCGATGMLLGSGLVLGWLMRQGHRPELGVYFMGIGLGVVVTAFGAWGLAQIFPLWSEQWMAFAVVGLVFLFPAWIWRAPVPPVVTHKNNTNIAGSKRWLFLMFVSYFAAGWGFVVHATFTVAMVERIPQLQGFGSIAWGLVGVAAIPAVFVWDLIARQVGDTRALLLAFGFQIIAVVLPAISDSLTASLLSALGYGATFIGLVSLTLTLAGRRAPANPGKAMARLTLAYGLAQMVAPVVTGYLTQSTGSFHLALWVTAMVMTLGLLLLMQVERKKS
ncbi:MAG: YbfB/YjiJ family MFS transporter [Limnohabitans sp.]|nr:YbfB/YjiJ family MFS transporter [Limnohabitans sp.]